MYTLRSHNEVGVQCACMYIYIHVVYITLKYIKSQVKVAQYTGPLQKKFRVFFDQGTTSKKTFPAFLSGRGGGRSTKLFFVAAFKKTLEYFPVNLFWSGPLGEGVCVYTHLHAYNHIYIYTFISEHMYMLMKAA